MCDRCTAAAAWLKRAQEVPYHFSDGQVQAEEERRLIEQDAEIQEVTQ